jgi:hypothetical protein
MQREILHPGPGEQISFRDGNALNLTRSNLRLCSTRNIAMTAERTATIKAALKASTLSRADKNEQLL